MEFVKNAVSWFEIPVTDFDRAKNFYQTIFDFEMPVEDFGPVKLGILLHDRDGGGVGGGICMGPGYIPSETKGVKLYLTAGEDMTPVLNRIIPAGGSITLPKTEIAPGMGFMAFFNDTEGNNVGLYSPQ